jgi:predicted transcriptional regulator
LLGRYDWYDFIMKIAISLPEDLFRLADSCARGQHLSRSGLVAAALREYLQRHRAPMDPTAAWNDAIAKGGQPGDDSAALIARQQAKKRIRPMS